MLRPFPLAAHWKQAPLEDLPTPAVVYSEMRIRANNSALQSALRALDRTTHLFYAVKACTLPDVVELFPRLGWGLEVQSLAEWDTFSAVGNFGIYNSPRKTRRDLEEAACHRLIVIADNAEELRDLWALQDSGGFPLDLAYGIRVQFRASSGAFYWFGCKLGVDPETAEDLLRAARDRGQNLPSWLHCHQLTRCTSPEDWSTHVRTVVEWAAGIFEKLGHRFACIDLGGGLDSPSRLLAAGTTIAAMVESLRGVIGKLPYECDLAFELGRYAVADAALGLCRVVRTKQVFGQRWAIVDIGTNLLIPLPQARFYVSPVRDEACEHVAWGLGDATCSPNGVIEHDVALPLDLQPGELLAVRECGAYTYSLAEQFCDPVPQAAWWSSNGSVRPALPLRQYENRLSSENEIFKEVTRGR